MIRDKCTPMQKRTTPSEHSEWEERGIAKKGVGRGQGTGVAHLEIRVVHVFEHQRRSARLRSKRKDSNGIEIEKKAHSSWVEPARTIRPRTVEARKKEEEVMWVYTTGSLTTATRLMIFTPPRRFSRILISRLIFFFFTGFSTCDAITTRALRVWLKTEA